MERQFDYELVIADNGSHDRTLEIAEAFAESHRGVRVIHLDERGRGRALKKAWAESSATILSYMDIDLSTDLMAFPLLIEAMTVGGFDLAVGSRLMAGAEVRRGWKREMISRGYNCLVRAICRTRFSDAQCGFKAITKDAAAELLPLIEDGGWFFDTELLVMAEKLGFSICDIPVKWTDDDDSRVHVARTVVEDIKGLMKLRRRLRTVCMRRSKSELSEQPLSTSSRQHPVQ
jgi:glycosyltransferase involved in cell wall biosynthesis